jgi:hypothetical protein
MRHLALAALPALIATPALAADPPRDARPAIEAGLQFLADEAVSWKAERKCASCHHVPMTLWALGEAKARGYPVADKAVAELTAWVAAKDDPAKINPKQKERAQVTVNQGALHHALGLEAGGASDAAAKDALKTFLDAVLADQDKDGAWRLQIIWEPIGSTPDVVTALALLALTAKNAPDLGLAGKTALRNGLTWLDAQKASESTQGVALRLILAKRLDRPAADRRAMADDLLGRQKGDGGWPSAKDLKSDAYSTGQALYALAEAGRPADDPAVAAGVGFLLKTQDTDGSWEMKSRPGGPGGKAAKELAPIGHAGTAWAVLGLVRTAPAPAKQSK